MLIVPTVFGNTPAHYAAQAGKGKSFNCLLYHGADVNVKNQMGENVFETARRHGHPLLIEKAGMWHSYTLYTIICKLFTILS